MWNLNLTPDTFTLWSLHYFFTTLSPYSTQVANDHFHDQSEGTAAVRSSGRGGAGGAPSVRSTGLSAGRLAGRVGRVPSENGGGVGRGSCIDPRYVQRFRSMSTLLNQRLPANVNGGQSLGARYAALQAQKRERAMKEQVMMRERLYTLFSVAKYDSYVH